jgi:hypothetical protein
VPPTQQSGNHQIRGRYGIRRYLEPDRENGLSSTEKRVCCPGNPAETLGAVPERALLVVSTLSEAVSKAVKEIADGSVAHRMSGCTELLGKPSEALASPDERPGLFRCMAFH